MREELQAHGNPWISGFSICGRQPVFDLLGSLLSRCPMLPAGFLMTPKYRSDLPPCWYWHQNSDRSQAPCRTLKSLGSASLRQIVSRFGLFGPAVASSRSGHIVPRKRKYPRMNAKPKTKTQSTQRKVRPAGAKKSALTGARSSKRVSMKEGADKPAPARRKVSVPARRSMRRKIPTAADAIMAIPLGHKPEVRRNPDRRLEVISAGAVLVASVAIVLGIALTGPEPVPPTPVPATTAPADSAVPTPAEPEQTAKPQPDTKPPAARKTTAAKPKPAPVVLAEWARPAIDVRMHNIRRLYWNIMQDGEGPVGELAVHLQVEPEGHVSRAWVERSTLARNYGSFEASVVRELISAPFNATGADRPLGVVVPIAFDGTQSIVERILASDATDPVSSGRPYAQVLTREMPGVADASRHASAS